MSDDVDFYNLLRKDDFDVEREIIHQTLGTLIMRLCDVLPNHKNSLEPIANEMMEQIQRYRLSEASVNNYFTGNGYIAKQLKKHLAFYKWFNANSKTVDLFTSMTKIEKKIEAFNFHPTDDKELITKANNFYNSIHNAVKELNIVNFDTLVEKDEYHASNYQTGIYSDTNNIYNAVTVLRVEEENGLIHTLFIHPNNKDNMLFHYHPLEEKWIKSDFTLTFPNLTKLFKHEFVTKIYVKDTPKKEISFIEEYNNLNKKIIKLFDNEHLLSDVEYIPNTQSKYHHVFARDNNITSRIITGDDKYNITFINTKGEYPSRSCVVSLIAPGVPMTVKVESIPSHHAKVILFNMNLLVNYLTTKLTEKMPTTSETTH